MINNLDLKFLDRAKRVSELSDYKRIHIGCVAVYGNKVISTGFNSNRTHPLQAKLNRFRCKDISKFMLKYLVCIVFGALNCHGIR